MQMFNPRNTGMVPGVTGAPMGAPNLAFRPMVSPYMYAGAPNFPGGYPGSPMAPGYPLGQMQSNILRGLLPQDHR